MEPVFGRLKTSLGFTRFLGPKYDEISVFGDAKRHRKQKKSETNENNTFRPFRIYYFRLITLTFVTAPGSVKNLYKF